MSAAAIWVIIGFIGQAFFSMRFLVQWIWSEKHRRSVVPLAFWYFSLAGGTTLLTYAIWREDPVFIAGQAGGLLIYLRNLYLIRREGQEQRAAAAAAKGDQDPKG
ncbi:MAG: lipid-A-disaccharide synthase N-terminal domain-containing protein [Pseudomonadota bacterium]